MEGREEGKTQKERRKEISGKNTSRKEERISQAEPPQHTLTHRCIETAGRCRSSSCRTNSRFSLLQKPNRSLLKPRREGGREGGRGGGCQEGVRWTGGGWLREGANDPKKLKKEEKVIIWSRDKNERRKWRRDRQTRNLYQTCYTLRYREPPCWLASAPLALNDFP